MTVLALILAPSREVGKPNFRLHGLVNMHGENSYTTRSYMVVSVYDMSDLELHRVEEAEEERNERGRSKITVK
uniref:Uncharacterized protein n=1 Tax=Oryza sativa subsp. japonica TaxID=39947 RepID=Q68Y44_ORYSJ|nr:hypothetical protein [Oryza sativa Japonica Group]